MLHVVISTSAAARLAAAERFLARHPPSTEIIVVGASRGAADDLVRGLAQRRGATFGLARFSLTELAARVATTLAGERTTMPGTHATTEAMAARVAFEAVHAKELTHFSPVARMPGFPRALARTLHELRLAGIPVASLASASASASAGGGSADLAVLLERFEAELDRAAIDDRALLFTTAAEAWRPENVPWTDAPALLIDITIDSRSEETFIRAIADRSPSTLATMPEGDARARAAFEAMGATFTTEPDAAGPASDLTALRRHVFTNDKPPLRERSGEVRLFSAPGEGREAVEMVRRALDEAEAGVPFDEMAVILRAPQHYVGLLEHAAARGGVPM